MIEIIVAMDKNGGIGKSGKLPWNIPEELKIFKEKTLGKTVVVGRLTADGMSKLPKREVLVMSKSNSGLRHALGEKITHFPNTDNFVVIGGREIYKLALETLKVDTIHMSVVNGVYDCDTFFDKSWLHSFVVINMIEHKKFSHYTLARSDLGEDEYLTPLKSVLSTGIRRQTRNSHTLSTFGKHMKFDLRKGFPLLTTKKMFSRGIIEEFLFFFRGDTDSKILEKKNVNIWKKNTSKEFIEKCGLPYSEGVMGPMYGYQFRFFNAPYEIDTEGRSIQHIVKPEGGVDQLKNVVNLIKTDPHSRRILMTAYNPEYAQHGVLYPCHSIVLQFYVEDDNLDMFAYSRSADMFLGVPFNIASYSLMLHTIAKLTDTTPRFLNFSMGDAHIYEAHLRVVEKQLNNLRYPFPKLEITGLKTISDIPKLTSDNFIISGYKSNKRIRAEMIA
jgi:dihydrofolate reductase/thymidylate synthase